ncbi:reprolysin-like metallopeptidase [Lysobacter firmicutimachus]|uniref:Reprolysin-like metallopeptidase n=1 Tax=Lysobacter firmicutimachus TaxID=1792846 RepID=A0AAU8N2L9_9GAMM
MSTHAAAAAQGAASTASAPRAHRAALRHLPAPRALGEGFAKLPDRGDLVAYSRQVPDIRDGAYTWHRADLSEAHALAAIVDGRLSVTAPSGEKLQFRYEQHVEHASGDWTWVGQLEHGGAADQAIITFGDRAAFGRIAQPGKPALRLTLRDGQAWLVETDPNKIAQIDNSATRPTAPDYLLPPKAAAGASAAAETVPFTPAAAAAAAAGATTIDLVLGYTNGFAAGLGGASQAVTRLNYLVEVANNGYRNSELGARVRLVQTVQVTYADNTDNGDALEALTGTRTVPVDPAFNALRAARDQYGADLVSLVRKFNEPENSGCGIAWLIGGGQRAISANDAGNGYSVVSDGRDAGSGGTTYFCSDDTLAHELGHNMGAQHDRDTASSSGTLQYGAFAYSFGHKQSSPSSFHTIMAYGDSGQPGYLVFSNPRITFCGGQPCGVADWADNARALAQTMPIIATFRATVVPSRAVRGDVSGDGWADLLWRNGQAQQFAHWLAGSSQSLQGFASAAGFGMVASYDVGGVGDFNGDGRSDVLWKSDSERFMVLWLSTGNGYEQQAIGGFDPAWALLGVSDIDGDGRADLVWRSPNRERLAVWRMQGNVLAGAWDAPMPSWYQILGIGDFDGDGRGDVVYADTGSTNIYFSRGNYFAGQNVGGRPTGWNYADSADMNGDGRDDMLWLNPNTGVLSYWLMNGAAIVGNPSVGVRAGETFFAARDVTGDGRADLIWDAKAQLRVNVDLTGTSQRYSNAYPAGWQMRR